MLLLLTYSAHHNEILHTSRQLYYRGVQKSIVIDEVHFKPEQISIEFRIRSKYRKWDGCLVSKANRKNIYIYIYIYIQPIV